MLEFLIEQAAHLEMSAMERVGSAGHFVFPLAVRLRWIRT